MRVVVWYVGLRMRWVTMMMLDDSAWASAGMRRMKLRWGGTPGRYVVKHDGSLGSRLEPPKQCVWVRYFCNSVWRRGSQIVVFVLEAFAALRRADGPLQSEVDGEKADCLVPIGGREGEV